MTSRQTARDDLHHTQHARHRTGQRLCLISSMFAVTQQRQHQTPSPLPACLLLTFQGLCRLVQQRRLPDQQLCQLAAVAKPQQAP